MAATCAAFLEMKVKIKKTAEVKEMFERDISSDLSFHIYNQ
jgi:hypothetical protein